MDVHTIAVSRSVAQRRAGAIDYVPGDLTHFDTARRLLREYRPAVVFHLAGLAAAARDPKLILPTFQSNIVSTVNLLVAAQESYPSRIVLPGSLEEPQDDRGAATSPYGLSKWVSCAYGRMLGSIYDLPVAIGRLFLAYGPTSRDLHKLIPFVIQSLLGGRKPRLSSGRRDVDWIYIDDVVEALLILGTSAAAVGDTVDIGSGKLVSIRDLVNRIIELIDPALTVEFDLSLSRPFEQVRMADIARTQAILGWAPKTSLDEGLMNTIEWFRRNRSLGFPEPTAALAGSFD
jgi:nucleoside-diphosphate-sugar epimerase